MFSGLLPYEDFVQVIEELVHVVTNMASILQVMGYRISFKMVRKQTRITLDWLIFWLLPLRSGLQPPC